MALLAKAPNPFDMTAVGGTAPVVHSNRITKGTPQQEAVWDFLLNYDDNLVIEALAGTGKSTVSREAMHRLKAKYPNERIQYTCFNKSIADEFRPRCPAGVEVNTMHAFGLRALQRAMNPTIAKDKSYEVLSSIHGGDALKRWHRMAVVKLVSLAKNHAVGLQNEIKSEVTYANLEGICDTFDIDPNQGQTIDYAIKVLLGSIERSDVVDFDDMLWLPLIYRTKFPGCDRLFIDEAQDMNPVQHLLAERMNEDGQTIVVGDRNQAIYGFRGADSRSMDTMTERLGAHCLPLTVTFRCPQSHVRLAREIVSGYEAHESNPEGVLAYGGPHDLERVQPGDHVLCRANAPLVSECLGLIANGVKATMRGRAIGQQLESVVTKVNKFGEARTMSDFVSKLETYRIKEMTRLSAKEGVEDLIEQLTDRCNAVEAIASSCSSPSEVFPAIGKLFSDTDPSGYVLFSSIHRAKGTEARRVWLLDMPYAPPKPGVVTPEWLVTQRRNLSYVGLTRSLDTMSILAI